MLQRTLQVQRRTADSPLPLPLPAHAHTAGQPGDVTLRCMRVSPDYCHLAIGDASGNIRVYSLATMELLVLKEAHEGEVLALDYAASSTPPSCCASLLASAGRDSIIHIFDVSANYTLVNTLVRPRPAVSSAHYHCCHGLCVWLCAYMCCLCLRHCLCLYLRLMFVPLFVPLASSRQCLCLCLWPAPCRSPHPTLHCTAPDPHLHCTAPHPTLPCRMSTARRSLQSSSARMAAS